MILQENMIIEFSNELNLMTFLKYNILKSLTTYL